MSKIHRNLEEELRRADEQRAEMIKAWSSGERPEKLLGRIHENIEALQGEAGTPDEGKRRRPGSRKVRLPIWVAVGAVVAALVVLAVFCIGPNVSEDSIVIHGTTSTSTSGASQVESKGQVIESIAALFEEFPGFEQVDPDVLPATSLETAQVLGLVRAEEAAGFDAARPATRGDFALWIWRAWRLVLPEVAESRGIADIDVMDAEETKAVKTVVGLGILRLDASGTFSPNEDLTTEEAAGAFATLEGILQHR